MPISMCIQLHSQMLEILIGKSCFYSGEDAVTLCLSLFLSLIPSLSLCVSSPVIILLSPDREPVFNFNLSCLSHKTFTVSYDCCAMFK